MKALIIASMFVAFAGSASAAGNADRGKQKADQRIFLRQYFELQGFLLEQCAELYILQLFVYCSQTERLFFFLFFGFFFEVGEVLEVFFLVTQGEGLLVDLEGLLLLKIAAYPSLSFRVVKTHLINSLLALSLRRRDSSQPFNTA